MQKLSKQHKHISRREFFEAAEEVDLDNSKAKSLWNAIEGTHAADARSRMFHILYFLGALIACFSLVWFIESRVGLYGTSQLLLLCLAYATCFYATGCYFWKIKQEHLLGGLGVFAAVAIVPLITYSALKWLGWWPGKFPGTTGDFVLWMKSGWFALELSTIVITAITLWFIKFPLLTTILYTTLCFTAMDIAPVFSGLGTQDSHYGTHIWHVRSIVGIILGLALAVNAFFLDRKHKDAFAFWGYLFGVGTLWVSLTVIDNANWHVNIFYCIINIVLMLLSPLFQRKVFTVFGAAGLLLFLYRTAYDRFADSPAFPFILSGIGIAIVILSAVIHKHWPKVVRFFREK